MAHLKSARFTLHAKSFLQDLLRHEKQEKKRGKVRLLEIKLVARVTFSRSYL